LNVALLPNKTAFDRVIAWKYNPKGIIAHGVTGRGKTRAVWTLLKRVCQEGRSVAAFDASWWANEVAKRFEDRSVYDWLEKQHVVDVWFLDDIDKPVYTARAQEAFFTCLKIRCENNLPCLLTTNLTDAPLKAKFEPERGEALLERLYEHCEPIAF
jgi:DNA replication protein DnaC